MATEAMIQAGARAICAHTGDDPDKKTYAHEMKCTGHDREPEHRWEYWAPFARAVLEAPITEDEVERAAQELLRSGPHMPGRAFHFTYAEAYGFAAAALDAARYGALALSSNQDGTGGAA